MIRLRTFAAAAALIAAFSPATGAANDSIEGRWRLVEQRYERGRHDFAPSGETFVLELHETAGRLDGSIIFGKIEASWPAYLTPSGPADLGSVQVESDIAAGTAHAELRVLPRPGDDTILLVDERYRLDEQDRLLCTVDIRFERHGEIRGGFTWHRVFVREDRP